MSGFFPREEPGGRERSDSTLGALQTAALSHLREWSLSLSRRVRNQPIEEIPEDVLFHTYCQQGDVKKIDDMLKKGGDVDRLLQKRLGFEGLTPMHHGASLGHPDVITVSDIYFLLLNLSSLMHCLVAKRK